MRNNGKIIMLINYVKGLMKKYFSNYEVHASCRHEERFYWLFLGVYIKCKVRKEPCKNPVAHASTPSLILSFPLSSGVRPQ